MKFSELCQILFPYLQGRCHSQADVFDFLVLNSISDQKDNLADEIAKMSKTQKKNLFKGTSSFSHVAKQIYPAFDASELISTLKETIQGDALETLVETLNQYIPNVTVTNFAQKIADQLKEIISEETAVYRKVEIEGTINLRAALLEENDGRCPCCGKSLCLDSSKANTIIAVKIDSFDADPNQTSPSIGLCRECAELYKKGTLDKDLAKLKDDLRKRSDSRKQIGIISLEEELMATIERLLKNANSEKTKLNLKSLKLSKKIDRDNDEVFYNKVKNNVVRYFPNLYQTLSKCDGDNKKSYDCLATSIKMAFLKAEKNLSRKEDIFNLLADKVSIAGGCSKSVAEIIVSYFIQSCEVFDEISK